MELQARRVFRFALVTALSTTAGFALQLTFTPIPPVLAILLSLKPAAPMRPAEMLTLALVILITTGSGLLLVPLLRHYPVTALLVVGLGILASSWLTVNLRQAALGSFLAMGFVLVSCIGLMSEALARLMVESLAGGVLIVIFCQWLVYPFFPEEPLPKAPPPRPAPVATEASGWIALRSTFIVLPVYFLALATPGTMLAGLMKALVIGQQQTRSGARETGIELLGSTFLGGCLAIVCWLLLGLMPGLWMIFLLALATGLQGGARIHGVHKRHLSPSFWSNTLMTLWIMLAPALADSIGGQDVYRAFASRFGLFIVITLYAWLAITLLESWRRRRLKNRRSRCPSGPERSFRKSGHFG